MDAVTLTLGDQRFQLRPGISVRRLERRLMCAMRSGAGVVRLRLVGGRAVDAIVSRALPVTVERVPVVKKAEAGCGGEDRVDWDGFEMLPEDGTH